MTSMLITGIIIAITMQKIMIITSSEMETESTTDADSTEALITTSEKVEENTFNRTLNSSEDATQNITSQDRISNHSQRRAPYSIRNHHHYYKTQKSQNQLPRPNRRPPLYQKHRKKYRRSRRRPNFSGTNIPSGLSSSSIISKPYSKLPYKRNKPILLSEVLRSGSHHPYAKFKPSGLGGAPLKEYIEEDEFEASPFSSIDTADSLHPPFTKFGRPHGIEFSDDIHDSFAPPGAFEDEIIYPGAKHVKHFPMGIRRPPVSGGIFSATKPPDIYIDDELEGSLRSTHLKPPKNTYIDKDLLNLLQKMKQEGTRLESKPTESNGNTKDNDTGMSTVIPKLLLPFLPESTITKIQSYFKNLIGNKQDKDESTNNINKVVFIDENRDEEFNRNSNKLPYKTYSVTESTKDKDNSSTYFIILKSSDSKNNTLQHTNKNDSSDNKRRMQLHTTRPPNVKSTTIPSLQSLALQHYIMSLAGLTPHFRENQFLPKFNSLNKQPRTY